VVGVDSWRFSGVGSSWAAAERFSGGRTRDAPSAARFRVGMNVATCFA
jgi:hypothetical protein